jgi:peptidoglycan-N-acetylglucosamine deacetylase
LHDGFVLGNHTCDRADLKKLSRSRQAAELDNAAAEQRKLTATVPCAFRPPDGNYNSTTLSVAHYRRMAVWLWSVDTEDWKAAGSSSAYRVNRIVRLARQEGGELSLPVILMHSQPTGNPATALALPEIITFLRRHGYRFMALGG